MTGGPLSAPDLRSLDVAATMPGVEMILISDRPRRAAIGELVIEGNRRQMTDPAFMDELKQWIRFSPADAIRRGDGLFAAAAGNPVVPDWLGRTAFRFIVTADGETDRYARQLASSSGLALFFAEKADRQGWLAVGRACQRFQLQATTLGIRSAFVNQPVEVATLRSALAAAGGRPGQRPDLLLRFGRAHAAALFATPVDRSGPRLKSRPALHRAAGQKCDGGQGILSQSGHARRASTVSCARNFG